MMRSTTIAALIVVTLSAAAQNNNGDQQAYSRENGMSDPDRFFGILEDWATLSIAVASMATLAFTLISYRRRQFAEQQKEVVELDKRVVALETRFNERDKQKDRFASG